MSTQRLPWLLQAPSDFRARCNALLRRDTLDGAGAEIMALATHQLNNPNARKLSSVIATGLAANARLAPLSTFRLGVLSNATMDLVCDAIPAAAARHGVALDLVRSPLDQVMQQALDPSSEIRSGRCDGVLVYVDHRWFQLDRPTVDTTSAGDLVDQAINRLNTVVEGLQSGSDKCAVVLTTVATPPISSFGSYDRQIAGSVRGMIQSLNAQLTERAQHYGAVILDVAAIAEQIGTENWFDAKSWNQYKLPHAPLYTEDFADRIGCLVGAMRGKSRKCLILDLDNTLWAGVIGDDGLEGIQIGEGSPLGEAHLAVQKYALDLKSRGIILAVCSKNTDAIARTPFQSHPGMLMKESDITVFQANWVDKSTNVEAIAKSLDIGLDALVFLDDNPSERAHVRAALPMVAIPELPNDASLYTEMLANAGYFESVSFSSDDALRVSSYASNAKRLEVKAKSRNLCDYLTSLDMKLTCRPFDDLGRSRIAQLINKSNQFNLTTQRYTEAEVAEFQASDATLALQFRLSDKFGEMGMIGVIICTPLDTASERICVIECWVMSCRVLGRSVEQAMLHSTVELAKAQGISRIQARYLPTQKNSMVKEHYDKLGFALLRETETGERHYELHVDRYTAPVIYMQIDN